MLGQQIKYYRQQKGVKQDELADYLGVSFQAVSKWETGASDPDLSLLPKIAVYFGISIDDLFEMPYEEQMERIENLLCRRDRISPDTFQRTFAFLENTLKSKPTDIRALAYIACLYNYRAEIDHKSASYYAEKGLELDCENHDCWSAYLEANRGVCGDEWYDNHYEVIRFCKEQLVKHPDSFLMLYALAENMLADHLYDEAIPYIEKFKQVKENRRFMYHLYMGDVYFGRGELEKAKTTWEEMVQKYPDIWQAHNCLGEGYQKLGLWEEALREYEISYTMQESPRISDGLYAMSQIYESQRAYDKAIEVNQRILDCLKTDFDTTEGEHVDYILDEIKRLKKMLKTASEQPAASH